MVQLMLYVTIYSTVVIFKELNYDVLIIEYFSSNDDSFIYYHLVSLIKSIKLCLHKIHI